MTARAWTYRSWVRGTVVASSLLLLVSLALGEVVQSQSSPGPGAAVPAHRQAATVAVLTVHGEIDGVTLRSLERRVAEAKKRGFEAIVIDIDTPGGAVDAALDISHLLKNDAITNTVAWVNPQAFSAGTIIALACREIVVHPEATWGAAAPIALNQIGQLMALPDAERAKIEAPIRVQLVDDARRHHFDEQLVQAFVTVGLELWMLENRATGDRVFVDRVEYAAVFGEDPPQQIAPVRPPGAGSATRPVLPQFERLPLQGEATNEYENLTNEEREALQRQRVSEGQVLPPSRQPLTTADRDDWRLLGQVVSSDELLVLKPAESIDYGLATAIIRDDKELADYFGTDPTAIVRMNESWSENLVRGLISFWARAALMLIFVIGLLIEMALPGTGIFGGVAVIALLIFVGAPYLAGMAQWWEILLIVGGLALIAVELFLIPGTGVAGILGAICLIVGIIGTFVSGDVTSIKGQEQLLTGVAALLIAIFGAGIGIWILSRNAYDLPVLKRLVLSATTDASSASDEPGPGLLGAMGAPVNEAPSVGDVGVARTDLRPSGRADFGDRLLDVVTVGGYVAAGERVRITNIDPFRIEVEGE